jgi:hypothetical protein
MHDGKPFLAVSLFIHVHYKAILSILSDGDVEPLSYVDRLDCPFNKVTASSGL